MFAFFLTGIRGKASQRLWACLMAAVVAFGLISAPASAQDGMKIVAVVNDDIITEFDLVQRLRLAMIASGLSDSAETRSRLVPIVLRAMIDETLQIQEMRRVGIGAEDSEVNERLEALAKENNMSLEQFSASLAASGVSIDMVARQVRTELGWVFLMRARFGASVRANDKDIDDELRRLAATRGQAEYRLRQIYLAVSGDDAAQRRAAQQIVDQIAGGADFAALAQQFSQDQSAIEGGDLGWVTADQLDPALAKALADLAPGGTSAPLRGPGGYYILRLDDKRIVGGDGSDTTLPSRDAIAANLAIKRLQTLSRGYLSDLRRAAVIDIRL